MSNLLNEDAAHDPTAKVGEIIDLIQQIQVNKDSGDRWGRFTDVGIEFVKIAMGEIPLVGGTLGAIDGLYAMYEAGKKEEHTWKDIEEYPILRRMKMHPELLKVLDDIVLRKIDIAYKEYLATLDRTTLVSQITDIDVFTHKWVMEETEEAVGVTVLREFIRRTLVENSKKRDYKAEYKKYHSTPKAKKDRVKRNKNRRKFEREGRVKKGDGKEIDHKIPLSKGGGNGEKNLRVVSKKTNRKKATK